MDFPPSAQPSGSDNVTDWYVYRSRSYDRGDLAIPAESRRRKAPGERHSIRFTKSRILRHRLPRAPAFRGREIVIQNQENQDWTHLNIQVNRHYQIYDTKPIEAGSERTFKLDRFISRTGARFSLRYNELQSVRVYARRPTKDRATFFKEFETTQ
jgi:hypothetical protein